MLSVISSPTGASLDMESPESLLELEEKDLRRDLSFEDDSASLTFLLLESFDDFLEDLLDSAIRGRSSSESSNFEYSLDIGDIGSEDRRLRIKHRGRKGLKLILEIWKKIEVVTSLADLLK